MAEAMLQWGGFQFAISTAAYQTLTRTSEYRWARVPRIGTSDALQFTGYGPDTVELAGWIYPHFKGGLRQLDRLRAQGAAATPRPLVSGYGRFIGVYVAEQIQEGQRTFAPGGIPHRQDFNMRLARYDGGFLSAFF